jgi:hypothetical protein
VIKLESSPRPLPVNVDTVDVTDEVGSRKRLAFVSNITDFIVLFVLIDERPVLSTEN